jgi:magnesium chelatase subunit I
MKAEISSRDALRQLQAINGLMEKTAALGVGPGEEDAGRVAAAEFVLEGLYAHRRISRNEEVGFTADERRREAATAEEEPRRSKQRRQFN